MFNEIEPIAMKMLYTKKNKKLYCPRFQHHSPQTIKTNKLNESSLELYDCAYSYASIVSMHVCVCMPA